MLGFINFSWGSTVQTSEAKLPTFWELKKKKRKKQNKTIVSWVSKIHFLLSSKEPEIASHIPTSLWFPEHNTWVFDFSSLAGCHTKTHSAQWNEKLITVLFALLAEGILSWANGYDCFLILIFQMVIFYLWGWALALASELPRKVSLGGLLTDGKFFCEFVMIFKK